MTIGPDRDEFAEYDGAYVLGALSESERAAFEAHLRECSSCRAQVDELAQLPALLALAPATAYATASKAGSAATAGATDAANTTDPVIALLSAARGRRRRRRLVAVAAAAVAAACLVAVTAFIARDSGATPAPRRAAAAVAMSPLLPSPPIHATAEVDNLAWGTRIQLHCSYDEGWEPPSGAYYTLVVVNRSGESETLGSWSVPPGKDMTFTGGTSYHLPDIDAITVDTGDGTKVLQLHY